MNVRCELDKPFDQIMRDKKRFYRKTSKHIF